jgi:hypothetical protein
MTGEKPGFALRFSLCPSVPSVLKVFEFLCDLKALKTFTTEGTEKHREKKTLGIY